MNESDKETRFPTTRWSLILNAKEDLDKRRQALEELSQAYWEPLYCYLRRKGMAPADAEDAVQGFLTRMLQRDFLTNLDPERGRLRYYLRSALNNYVRDQHAKATSLKRGGPQSSLVLDFEVAESQFSHVPLDPEEAYHRQWATQLIERAHDALIREYEQGRRKGPIELIRKLFGFGEVPPYQQIAEEYDMTVSQVKSFVHRARMHFRKLLLASVADTVCNDDEVSDEVAALFSLLG